MTSPPEDLTGLYPRRTACPCWRGEGTRRVVVAGAETLAHVGDGRVQGERRRGVRLVRDDELLESGDDLEVGNGEWVHVEAEHARDDLAEVEKLKVFETTMILPTQLQDSN